MSKKERYIVQADAASSQSSKQAIYRNEGNYVVSVDDGSAQFRICSSEQKEQTMKSYEIVEVSTGVSIE